MLSISFPMINNNNDKNLFMKIGYSQNWITVTEGSLPNIASTVFFFYCSFVCLMNMNRFLLPCLLLSLRFLLRFLFLFCMTVLIEICMLFIFACFFFLYFFRFQNSDCTVYRDRCFMITNTIWISGDFSCHMDKNKSWAIVLFWFFFFFHLK